MRILVAPDKFKGVLSAREVAENIALGLREVLTNAEIELAPVAGQSTWYFLGPRAGGIELQVGNRRVMVVTPQSPLGRQLLGRRVGDDVDTPSRTIRLKLRIVSVA